MNEKRCSMSLLYSKKRKRETSTANEPWKGDKGAGHAANNVNEGEKKRSYSSQEIRRKRKVEDSRAREKGKRFLVPLQNWND